MQSEPGTYVVVLKFSTSGKTIPIGKNRKIRLERGYYYYVGSAFGPGGVLARASHHLKISAKPRWHLDYLRKHTNVIAIWYTYDRNKREHQWATIFQKNILAKIPLPGFGSSDCNCSSHLFFSKTALEFSHFLDSVKNRLQQHDKIFIYPG